MGAYVCAFHCVQMFLFFVTAFGAVVRVAVGVVAEVHFVHGLEGLGEIVLQGGDRCTHRRAAEAMGDEVEVGQATLDARLQDRVGPRVPQGRSVLSQQVSELFADLSAGNRERSEASHQALEAVRNHCYLCHPAHLRPLRTQGQPLRIIEPVTTKPTLLGQDLLTKMEAQSISSQRGPKLKAPRENHSKSCLSG